MEIVALIISGISALAAVASAIAAFKAKKEVKALTNQISNNHQRTVKSKGNLEISNNGKNSGTIMGINTGNVNDR